MSILVNAVPCFSENNADWAFFLSGYQAVSGLSLVQAWPTSWAAAAAAFLQPVTPPQGVLISKKHPSLQTFCFYLAKWRNLWWNSFTRFFTRSHLGLPLAVTSIMDWTAENILIHWWMKRLILCLHSSSFVQPKVQNSKIFIFIKTNRRSLFNNWVKMIT